MFKIFSSSGLPAVDEAFAARRPVLDGLESVCLRGLSLEFSVFCRLHRLSPLLQERQKQREMSE